MTAAGGLVIYHACETSLPHLELQLDIPANALNVGEGVDIAAVTETLDNRKCLTGNFDPMLLRDGTVSQVIEATAGMVAASGTCSGYIFNTGEGIMSNTPPENVAAMITTARAHVPPSDLRKKHLS
jgi:uroporphyrinogen decarboxylase